MLGITVIAIDSAHLRASFTVLLSSESLPLASPGR
jgi:hypothetical protein